MGDERRVSNGVLEDRDAPKSGTASTVSFMSSMNMSAMGTAMKTESLRVLLALAPLFMCLIALATYAIVIRYQDLSHAETILEDVYDEEHIREVVDGLEQERRATCFYLTSIRNDNDTGKAGEELERYRNYTDHHWHHVLYQTKHTHIVTQTTIEFTGSLQTFRREIDITTPPCQRALDFYTEWIDYFLVDMLRNFPVEENEEFFILYTYLNVIQIKDLIGLKRAEGAQAFDFNATVDEQNNRIWNLIGLSATLRELYRTARAVFPHIFEEKDTEHKALLRMIEGLEWDIINRKSHSDAGDEAAILSNLTAYMEVYSEMETHLSKLLIHEISRMAGKFKRQFNMDLYIFIGALLVGIPCIGGYMVSLRAMQKKILDRSDRLATQTTQVTREKQKTDILLFQLLPKPIARDLLDGKDIPPQFFESVTIMFSDITDFQTAAMSPYQIVEFLNGYYNICDHVIERYQCYKVEVTLGQYLVASGVPTVHMTHSEELCTMALDLHQALQDLKLSAADDYGTPKPVRITTGCHTGSIAAGVVGIKMPKYCLFGDVVNTAARMQTTAIDGQIQISAACRAHLQFYSPNLFQMERRGDVNVKGKGKLETYWLLRKVGFPFQIKQVEFDDGVEDDAASDM